MANRHLARSLAMQSLFECDFNNCDSTKIASVVRHNVDEFGPGLDDINFVTKLAEGVIKERERLDHIITKAAPDWPLEQIAAVDRNILRLGLYELLFGNRAEVPARVAINEAIELAKTFGGENSGRFVNGVLGAVYRELGEPGRNDAPVKKKRIKDIPYDQMPIEKLGGALVYSKTGKQIYLAFVHDVFGYWTLSKGHIEAGEDVETGTKREIKEEMNVDIELEEKIGSNEYQASDPEKGKIRKQVIYFLARAKNKKSLRLAEGKGGLDDARWFPLEEIVDLKIYHDILPIITTGIKKLVGSES